MPPGRGLTHTMDDLLHLDQVASLPDGPDLYAVIGFPVAHSLSPQFQQPAFDALGLQARYLKIEVPLGELPRAVELFRQKGFKGWNCTLPHKAELAGLVDTLGDSARRLGVVNTVVNEGGKLTGFNTDGEGWVRAVREDFGVDVRDLRIMILGAGGAGQGLAIQAALEKCERLVLVNRTVEKAEALRAQVTALLHSDRLQGANDPLKIIPFDEEKIAAELNTIDLVVNATSSGLKPSDPAVLPARILQPHLMVYDTIYRPTRLLEAAAEVGARTAGGLSMLLHQGALSFERWTGQAAPLEVMRKNLKSAAGLS
jgi:shikimate dehydrogenase